MRISRFEDLRVWRKSLALAVAIYRVTETGTFSRDFGLKDQVRRSATSVMSNIAEGFGRYSPAEMRRFVVIARGSASEAQSQLHLALALGYITEAEHRPLNEKCIEISRMLAALRTSLDRPR